ncbi:hypothetical protein RchiOBHm_Chr2g0121491 [Rosa chinensis]|uniref:Uncharacterized protein n=1 Tax=Rosa chinensis TaxID=74649 RepID=A0A2P6RSI0_ROSCH|nr:hypothetical protein RchiOBHm_Chr2g0121491 [Rosa chinensis]
MQSSPLLLSSQPSTQSVVRRETQVLLFPGEYLKLWTCWREGGTFRPAVTLTKLFSALLSSTLPAPPPVARRSWRSMTTTNCNVFIDLGFAKMSFLFISLIFTINFSFL